MATSPSANPTPITPPRVPLIDPRSGLIAREWYLFFLSLFRTSQTVDYLDLFPQTQDASGELAQVYSDAQLAAMPALPQLDEILKRIQALECQPVPEPRNAPRYGSFSDTTDQTQTATNTAKAMTFNTTDLSFGVYIGSPSSRIYVDRISVYNIQFSAQILNASGGTHDIWIWLRKNGTDVADSATQIRVEGNNTEAVAAWNFLLKMNADDYFELMWEVTDTAVSLWHDAGTAVHPAIPSVLLSVTDNISNY